MATSLSAHRTARATAGADYAAKATAFVNAWIEIQAYDQTVTNTGIGGTPGGLGFGEQPTVPVHGEFLKTSPTNDLAGRVKTRHEALLAS